MELSQNILPRGILVTQFIEDTNNYTDEQLAEKYNVSFRTLRRWKQKIRESEEDIAAVVFPESPTPRYTDFLKLEYDKVMVIGDMECPDHDSEILDMAVSLAEQLDVRHLILNGDVVSLDCFSEWPAVNKQSNDFERDLELLTKIIKVFTNTFDTVDYLTGNHERRLAKQTKAHNNIGMFLKHLYGVQYSNYTYAELVSGDKEILIVHPEDYSRVPCSVPLKLASIHHKNILCGHTHRASFSYDPSGRYWVAEGGHCRDESRTLYKSMKMASFPRWNSGFSLIYNGCFYFINRDNFNFWYNNVKL